MMPGNAKVRHVAIEKLNNELAEAANTLPMNRVEMNDTKIGVITSGIPYQYVKEALPEASVLKLGNGQSTSEKADRGLLHPE